MDFAWTAEQLQLRDNVVEFAQKELVFDHTIHDREQRFPAEAWKKCGKFGVFGWPFPKDVGGSGFDRLTSVLLLEGLGYGCRENGLPFAINSQMWSTQIALEKFANEEQKEKYLKPLCLGEAYGTFGITEVESGSDSYAMSTTAEKVDGGYVLNGEKAYLTLAPICDLAVIFAKVKGKPEKWGITAFIVEKDFDGFTRAPLREKMGLRSTPMGDLVMKDCFVPEGNRLGPEGGGVSLFSSVMVTDRGHLFASHLGALARQLEEAIKFAGGRKAFGRPIGQFQSVSNRLVDAKVKLEMAKMMLYKVAWMEDHGQPSLMHAAMTKLAASEFIMEASIDFSRVFGTKGYTTDQEVERDVRDSIGGVIYSGTSDIQRNIIAKFMGL